MPCLWWNTLWFCLIQFESNGSYFSLLSPSLFVKINVECTPTVQCFCSVCVILFPFSPFLLWEFTTQIFSTSTSKIKQYNTVDTQHMKSCFNRLNSNQTKQNRRKVNAVFMNLINWNLKRKNNIYVQRSFSFVQSQKTPSFRIRDSSFTFRIVIFNFWILNWYLIGLI